MRIQRPFNKEERNPNSAQPESRGNKNPAAHLRAGFVLAVADHYRADGYPAAIQASSRANRLEIVRIAWHAALASAVAL